MREPKRQISSLGKLPPQALDLEEAVLGALMLEKSAFMNVSDILTDDCFYKDAHQKIFSTILHLENKSHPIDILTVCAELRQRGELETIGGAFYITELTNRVASAANIEFHARIIKQKSIQRNLIKLGTDLINNSYDDISDPFELIESSSNNLYEMISGSLGRDFVNYNSLIYDRYRKYREPIEDGLTGIPSYLKELDRITNGFQDSDLIILAARPAMGKTALALHFARKCAIDSNKPIAFFSLEMSKEQLIDRLISAESGVELEALKKHNLRHDQNERLNKSFDRMASSNIIIDDSSMLTVNQFKAKALRMQQKNGIKMIVVDYLQLMSGSSKKMGNREQEISEISRSLKQVAKDLNLPVIALSQLSRALESRPGGSKKPMLSDLRESGSIEQDADMVMFLYRPEYYGIEQDESGNSTENLAEIIIAKHRNGEVDVAKCQFIGKLQQFKDEESKFLETFGSEEINSMPNSDLANW